MGHGDTEWTDVRIDLLEILKLSKEIVSKETIQLINISPPKEIPQKPDFKPSIYTIYTTIRIPNCPIRRCDTTRRYVWRWGSECQSFGLASASSRRLSVKH